MHIVYMEETNEVNYTKAKNCKTKQNKTKHTKTHTHKHTHCHISGIEC